MTSLAASPGTAVEPMWSSRTSAGRSAYRMRAAIRAYCGRPAGVGRHQHRTGVPDGTLFPQVALVGHQPVAPEPVDGGVQVGQGAVVAQQHVGSRPAPRVVGLGARSARSASPAVIPRSRISRSIRTAGSVCTTITRWYVAARPTSTSSGTSLTTIASAGAAATSSALRARTRGWVIASSRAPGRRRRRRPPRRARRGPEPRRGPAPRSRRSRRSPPARRCRPPPPRGRSGRRR